MSEESFWDQSYRKNQHLERWHYDRPSQELVTAVACGMVVKGAVCLDLGCGAGEESTYLASLGYEIHAIDVSAVAIELAQTKSQTEGLTVHWQVGSVLEMPYADGQFDFATDRGCLHHIDPADRPRYASELARVLAPGGRCLLRGCREEVSFARFVLINEEVMQDYFAPVGLSWSTLQPISLISLSGDLPAYVTMLRKE